jgi:large subunit ribosomal protein L25
MSNITLTAKPRTLDQKPAALRRMGNVLANITVPHHESQAIVLVQKEIQKLIAHHQETALVYVAVDGQTAPVPALIDEIQQDAMSGQILHVVFKQVSLKEKVTSEVPLELVGEIDVPGGVLIKVKETVEVEALPTDLPEKIEIDISGLTEIGQSILFKDLKIDTTKIKLMLEETELESPVVLIQEHKEEPVEEVVAEPAEGEAPATGDKPAEAAPAAEGEKTDKAE